MSATIEVPTGLDSLTPEEQRLMDSMRDDGPDDAAAPTQDAPPVAEAPDDIEIPDLDEPAPRADGRRTVPHAQFHAAREEAKAAKKALADSDAKRIEAETKLATETARIQERVNLLTALAQTPPATPVPAAAVAEEDPIPDVNVDPIGHFQKAFERLSKQVETRDAVIQGLQEHQRQAAQITELQNWGSTQEAAYMLHEPAYAPAMEHLKKTYDEELVDLGIVDPAHRQREINNMVTAVALKARQDGANFAERLYRQALRRGFVKSTPATAPLSPAPEIVSGGVIPPLDSAPSPAAARAARVEEGRDNSMTIGTVGAAPPGRISLEKLSSLPDEQFAKVMERARANGIGSVMDILGH